MAERLNLEIKYWKCERDAEEKLEHKK